MPGIIGGALLVFIQALGFFVTPRCSAVRRTR
jgi:ABC-type spermidine/putrescine transport system permease subunit I